MNTALAHWRLRLGGLALGVLLVLVCAPATRKFVTAQAAAIFFPDRIEVGLRGDLSANDQAARNARNDARLRAAAARRPNDFPVQLTCALNAGDVREQAARLHALAPRFGDNPSLWVAVLRVYSRGTISLQYRTNEVMAVLEPGRPREKYLGVPKAPTPDDLAAFDNAAARGERLDPNNALFPLLRAAGLFAARRDDAALAALRRAGQKTTWNDYTTDEATGHWRLTELANGAWGTTGALGRSAQAAAILLPHYALLRNGARLGVVHAIRAEQAGRTAEGLELRRALARCGRTLRKSSGFLVGTFVGAALTQMTTVRPGGVPPPNDPFDGAGGGDSASQARVQAAVERARGAYFAYLKRIGAPDEARWMRAELDADEQTRRVGARVIHQSSFGAPLQKLAGWWVLGLLALGNIVWLVVLGGLTVPLARTRLVRAGLALPVWARKGVWGGLVALVLAVALNLPAEARALFLIGGETFALAAGLCWGTSALAIRLLRRARRRGHEDTTATIRPAAGHDGKLRPALRALGVAALTIAGTLLLSFAAHEQARATSSLIALADTLSGISSEGGPNRWAQLLITVLPVAAPLTLAAPLLLVVALGIASRVVRVPLTAGLVRGLKGTALPAACVLVLVYGGLVLATVRQDALVDEGLRQTLAHEGRYLAGRAGVRWPE